MTTKEVLIALGFEMKDGYWCCYQPFEGFTYYFDISVNNDLFMGMVMSNGTVEQLSVTKYDTLNQVLLDYSIKEKFKKELRSLEIHQIADRIKNLPPE